jgi:hypothetical protein
LNSFFFCLLLLQLAFRISDWREENKVVRNGGKEFDWPTDRHSESFVSGWTVDVGGKDRRTDGQTDRQTDRQTHGGIVR